VLLIGDAIPPRSGDFPRLPNAAREIAQVGNLFPAESRTVFTGAQATPAVYREAHPEKFALIHFAAHATANREDPLDSAVILSQSQQGFRLYAREVLKTPLDTGLVTISACRSAGARSFAGEGLVGLAWAFLSAGAHNVIAGLWNVEDGSTAQMMEQIYREMRAGTAPAIALRSAKLSLLHSKTAYRKPFYWAPFVLFTRSAAPLGSGF
jgi:CHAT domain-containing protein